MLNRWKGLVRRVRAFVPKNPIKLTELINAGAALGSVFIALLAFLTSMKVSGLEDYFRSELDLRNKEMSVRANRLIAMERELTNQVELRNRLQTENVELLAEQLASEAELRSVSSRVVSGEQEVRHLTQQVDSVRTMYEKSGEDLKVAQERLTDINTSNSLSIVKVNISIGVIRSDSPTLYLRPIVSHAFLVAEKPSEAVKERLRYVESKISTHCAIDFDANHAGRNDGQDLRAYWLSNRSAEEAEADFKEMEEDRARKRKLAEDLSTCIDLIDESRPSENRFAEPLLTDLKKR